MSEKVLVRRTFAHLNLGIGEIHGLLVDFYEEAGSLDALDPLTSEELQAAFNAVQALIQKRQASGVYPSKPADLPSPTA